MTRNEHLAWAKQRAFKYVDVGDLTNAFASMVSDLRKHDELANHMGIELGFRELVAGQLDTGYRMRHWIEGFN